MNTKVFYIRLIFCVAAILVSIVALDGCKKDNPVSGNDMPSAEDIFPIAAGRGWVMTTYILDTANSQPISSTIHRESSYAVGTTSIGGKTAFHMIDSVYTPEGILDNASDSYIAIENGDVFQWNGTNGGWFLMYKKSAGLNTEYEISHFQQTQEGVGPIDVRLTGTVFPKESVTAPIGTVQAYKLEIKITFTVGTISYPPQLQYFYFAEGYGPVRIYTPVQNFTGSNIKSQGQESLLVSKNY